MKQVECNPNFVDLLRMAWYVALSAPTVPAEVFYRVVTDQ